MKSATKSLFLNVLLGSCFFLACGDLHAVDRAAGPVLPKLIKQSEVAGPKVIDAPRLPAHAVIDTNLQEPLVTPYATAPPVVESIPHTPAPYSIPLDVQPLEDANTTIPHAGCCVLNDDAAIVGDSFHIDGLATPRANVPYQHPAPEVVLRFSSGCTDAEFTNWSLSSRDVPRARPAIPHGPLMIELRLYVEPVDFVELMLDGKPLKPTDYATASPLSYELPCPTAGQHVLQARYLSGNIWSYYSNALRFEVRLPQQPRIIAASDFDRDPTPLTRHGVTSITTDSIKVHLAHVARGDSVVAYVDGKPISTQSDHEICCRIIKVEGLVAPGLHKLVVRTVGCPGSCSITSKPSNEIAFHYYDEDVYLLRPGAGCNNKRPNQDCPPTLKSTSGVRRTKRDLPIALNPQESRVIGRPQGSSEDGQREPSRNEGQLTGRGTGQHVSGTSVFHFVSYLQANSAVNAQKHADEAQQFSERTRQEYVAAHNHAAAASTQASSAANIAQTAQQESDAVAAHVRRAKTVATDTAKIHSTVTQMSRRPGSAAAIDAAKLAATEAGKAYLVAEQALRQAEAHARLAAKHAQVASRYATAATKPRELAKAVRDHAAEVAKEAQSQATSAKTLEANSFVAEARRAEQQAAVERNRVEAAFRYAESMTTESEKFEKLATDFKDRANLELSAARSELVKAKNASQQVADARTRTQNSHALAITHDLAANAQDAADAYTATKKILDATTAAVVAAAQDEVKRSQESVDDAEAAVEEAESHYRRAHGLLKDAALALKHTQDAANKAARESVRASAYADVEATCGDEARARVARDRSNLAAQHAQLTSDQLGLANQNYDHTEAVVSDAQTAVRNAQAHLASAKTFRDFAQKEVDQLVAARADIAQAEEKAREAYNREATLRNGQDFAGAKQALRDVLAAKRIAENRSKDVIAHGKQAKQYADWATDRESDARAEARRAGHAVDRAHAFTAVVNEAARRAAQLASVAASNAQHAGRVLEKDAATERAWDEAEEKAAYEAAEARFKTAKAGTDENGVKRAHESAQAAQIRATQEWNKATDRIAEAEANARRALAEKVVGPSSPFFFASAAHFPLPEFGLQGEMLNRGGLIIYEDMELRFDRDGNYEVHFRATTPELPVTLKLQFQIQPHRGGPWHTITLSPISFPYEDPAKAEQKRKLMSGEEGHADPGCCGPVRTCVCRGHSEILRRCYAEIGAEARIRRQGTARFGFGLDSL